MAKIYFKKPVGFRNFTDFKGRKDRKEIEKEGYKTIIGRYPYSPRGKKVLFYKRKRK